MGFDYDIAIIGLGPAGATLARMTAGTMSVFALTRPVGEGGFSKPCGGLLSSDAQKALAGFEITLPKDILVDPQIFSVRTIDLPKGITRHYQRFYINLDRAKFDKWLISFIPQNATIEYGICRSISRLPGGGFNITYSVGGETHSITSRYVVGADGANSTVRRNLFPNKRFNALVSIQQWFPEQNARPFYSCIFDNETSKHCSWSVSKDNYFIFGGAFDIKGARAAFEAQKQRLAAYCGFRFGEPIKTEACIVLRPKTPLDFCTGGSNAFLIGEAAGFISPSSFEGISWAINSAALLCDALKSKSPNSVYNRHTFGIKLKLLLKRLKCPFMYNSLLRRIVMASGLKTIKTFGSGE